MPADADTGWEVSRRRFRIAGRVQGVGYRAWAARAARSLRLTGGASNLDDGTVEVVAEGPVHALDRLEAALGEGPRLSRVDAVRTETLAPESAAGPFDVEF